MDKNRVFKAKALHYWLNFTERLAEIILHRSPDSYDVTLEKCVPYGQGKYNNLDIIRPKTGTGKKLPLMIYVHGGGWISGVKSMRRTYCYEYAKKGVVVANIDYIWAPLKQFRIPFRTCWTQSISCSTTRNDLISTRRKLSSVESRRAFTSA